MITITAGRRRIKDRNIRWHEHYGQKSGDLKRHYEKVLPGSYFRWEGYDYETMHPYYVVVGPSVSQRYGKMFFAGIKKLPNEPKKKTYPPAGKYFSNLSAAMKHAEEYWGVQRPPNMTNYSKTQLMTIHIPKHIY